MALTVLTHNFVRPDHPGPCPARPVRACGRDLQAQTAIGAHAHHWGQLTFALSGVLRVYADRSTWIVPPQRAVWIAPGVEHAIDVLETAQIRPLEVLAARAPFAGEACRVVDVSPLLREAIVALGEAESDAGSAGEALLSEVILDELGRSTTAPIRVPLPGDKRLRALCAALLADPCSPRTLAEWAHAVGASERTLARLFEKELGMGFLRWRQQARLAHAAPLIARGTPLAQVAAELGYASQSAFTAMFKKTFGVPPTTFFARTAPA
jgi:AraC-like DNA-binding protein